MIMAASSIYMAAASSSTSLPFHNRIANLSSFDPSSITITTLSPKPISTTLKLKYQNPNFPLHLFVSRPHLCHASANFDSWEDDAEDHQVSEQEETDQEEEEEEQPRPGEESRLYVGNLPYAMTASQLSDIFQEAGQVDTVEIVYDKVTDRSRGFAFVTMGNVQEAKEAIRMFDGSQVGGRTVKVNFPEVPRGGEREVMGPKMRSSSRSFIDSPHKVYAGNLGWGLTSQGLRDAFADQPGLLSAKVIYERDTGRSRGFGFVSFASADEAQAAIDAMNGVEVEGRPLRLNLAAERASTSFPTGETKANPDLQGNEMLSSINA